MTYLCACRNPLEKRPPDSNQLFDPEVLDYFNISWLEKPENALNEKQYVDGFYTYEASFSSLTECLNYRNNCFAQFQDRDYLTFYRVATDSHGEFWNHTICCIMTQSENPDDFMVVSGDRIVFEIYFTTEEIGEYDDQHSAYSVFEVNCLSMIINTSKTYYNEFVMKITLNNHYNHYYMSSSDTTA